MHRHPIIIKEAHLDTFGHVNNATYLQLFEDARWEMITAGGYGLEKIKKTGLGPIILDINIRFKQELCLREKIAIETEVQSYDGKIGKMTQHMRLPDGKVACDAQFTVAFFDLKKRKIIEPNSEWLKALGQE